MLVVVAESFLLLLMFDTYTLTDVVVGGGQRAYLLLATTFGPHDKRTGPTLTRLMDCYVVRQAGEGLDENS